MFELVCSFCGQKLKLDSSGLWGDKTGPSCRYSPSEYHIAVSNSIHCVYCGDKVKSNSQGLWGDVRGPFCPTSPAGKHQLAYTGPKVRESNKVNNSSDIFKEIFSTSRKKSIEISNLQEDAIIPAEKLDELKKELTFIGYCYSCDEAIFDQDLISKKHNEIFHQECYRSYINTDKGREWDSKENENERLDEEERQQKIKEYNAWLKTPEGVEFIAKKEKEERQKELEQKEKKNKERIDSEIKQIAINYFIINKNRKGFLLSLLLIPFLSYVLSSIICSVIPFAAMGDILFGGEYAQIKITMLMSLTLYLIRLPKYKLPKKTNEVIKIKNEIQTLERSKFNYIKELYDKINEYSNEFKDYVYILDENKEKLEKAKNTYASYTDIEIPLIMYNDTVTNSAKDGFVLTNINLYAHSAFDKNIKIPINEISSITLQNTNLVVNDYKITLSVLNKLDKEYLLFLVNELLQEDTI